MDNLYLAHHGVKGQKWGVRRYQNEDGSLTPEGKKLSKQYAKLSTASNKKDSKKYNKAYTESVIEAQSKSRNEEEFKKIYTKVYNTKFLDIMTNSPSYQKAQNFAKKYEMEKWDKLAKDNADFIKELKDSLKK